MAFSIANGMGDSIDEPSPAQMRTFLFDVDTSDVEHSAAWLSTDDHTLEWSGAYGGLLVFSPATAESSGASRHLVDVPPERTLELWRMLSEGRLEELEDQPWLAGNGWRPDPEREASLAAAQCEADREFYESLGAERADTCCRRETCTRGAVRWSVFCRPHHFESVRSKSCPFDD
jgi:hypothetical protein